MQIVPKGDRAYAPPEFGIEANALKTIRIPLDNARDLVAFEIGGTCLWAQAASDLAAQVDIRFNDQLRDAMAISQGFFIRGVPFSRIYVSNTAQAGKWITLFYTVEDKDNIQIVNPSTQFNNVQADIISSITLAVNQTKATVFSSSANVAIAAISQELLLAANPNRRVAHISNAGSSAGKVWIGDAEAALTEGCELGLGEKIAIETTGAIYGYSQLGCTVGLAWTED